MAMECAVSPAFDPCTMANIARSDRQTVNVESVRNGLAAANANVVWALARTSRSTGLPKRMKRRACGNRSRAKVTATTESSKFRSCGPGG